MLFRSSIWHRHAAYCWVTIFLLFFRGILRKANPSFPQTTQHQCSWQSVDSCSKAKRSRTPGISYFASGAAVLLHFQTLYLHILGWTLLFSIDYHFTTTSTTSLQSFLFYFFRPLFTVTTCYSLPSPNPNSEECGGVVMC